MKYKKLQAQKDPQSSSENINKSICIPAEAGRIVDLKGMARKMFCSQCNDKLGSCDIVEETLLGLGSIFHVKCPKCNFVTKTNLSDRYFNSATKGSLFETNSKASLGNLFLFKIVFYNNL